MKFKGTKVALGILAFLVCGGSFFEWIIPSAKAPELKQSLLHFEDFELSKVTPELSMQSLEDMKLVGTNLTFVKELKDHYSYVSHEVFYLSNGVKISGVLNIPKLEGVFPLIILNHGWYPLDLYKVGTGMKREQDYFAKNKYVVFHPDYRDHAESEKDVDPRQIYDGTLGYAIDSINAVNAIKNAGIEKVDTTRVGLLGHSMGGDIGLDIATTHPYVFTAMALYAPANANAWLNFDRWKHQDFPWIFIDRTLKTLGTYKENPKNWDQMSASSRLDRIQVPIKVYHGGQDAIVPVRWSQELVKKLKRLGKNVEIRIYPDEDHEFQPSYSDYIFNVEDFFEAYLGKDS